MAMTRIERSSIAGAALIAVIAPAITLGFGASPGPRERVTPPLLAPREAPVLSAVYRRALFGNAGLSPVVGDAMPDDAPNLVGIAGRIGQDAVALVRSAGRTRTIAPGAAVDGWRLESLSIDAAYFMRGGRQVRVPLPVGE